MALTLLGGIARGLALDVPKGDTVRPTSVMLRRKIFDAHQDLSNTTFIDLCAGTGAIGFEAWSRGAESLYLVEADVRAYKQLSLNIKKINTKFSEESDERRIFSKQAKALQWLSQFRQEYERWDFAKQQETILFLDPPYEKKSIYQEIVTFALRDWFSGRLWIESDRQKGLASEYWQPWESQFVKTYVQGTSYIAILDLRESLG
tara:strand:- start:3876 stop:4487 length:612 start_codon:yes stop_codon:yes gene_type:complete